MAIIQLGEWTIDVPARTISHGARTRSVSPKAICVLQTLVEAGGSVVSRDRLLDTAWPDVTVGEEVLTHAIAELRRAFAQTSGGEAPLSTIYKSGYRLSESAIQAVPSSPGGEDLSSFAPFLAARCLSELDGADNARDAVRLYEEAIANDPGFAGAHSGLALKQVCCRFCYGGHPNTVEHALEHARIAVRLDPFSAETHLALGNTLAAMGEWSAAIPNFKTALRLAPTLGETYQLLSIAFFRTGHYEASSAACDRAAAFLPEDSCALLRGARSRRAMNDDKGSAARVAKAQARVERRLKEDPDDLRSQCQMFSCLVESGSHDEAFQRLQPVLGVAHPVTNMTIGGLTKAGAVNLALDQLEAAMAGGWSDPAMLAHDPDVAPLKKEKRFRRLTAHMR